MKEVDVLVLGGGLAGLCAAYRTELPEGGKLAVLSTGTGASPYVHGFSLPLHPEDSAERFLQDTLKSGAWQSDSVMAEALCNGGPDVLELLRELDIALDAADGSYRLLQPLGAGVPRVACAGNHTGAVLMQKLKEKLRARGDVCFYDGLRALRLMVHEGTVQGVLAYDAQKQTFQFIRAKATVLACGGFCNIYKFSDNSADIGGDAVAMAYAAGVPLSDMEFIQFEPSIALAPAAVRGRGMITTLFYEGAVLRNAAGERFMERIHPDAERVDKDVLAYHIQLEANKNPTPNGGVWFDATGVKPERLREAYPSYVKRYADVGIDITREAFEIGCAPHTSLGGIAATADGETRVSGLFACGESIGGVHGANRVGGNAGLETLVFGMRAGRAAARYLQTQHGRCRAEDAEVNNWINDILCNRKLQDLGCVFRTSGEAALFCTEGQGTDASARLDELRRLMQDALEAGLNVIRCEEGIRAAIDAFSEISEELTGIAKVCGKKSTYQRLRLENDLCAANLLAVSALERKGTVGCHIRSDAVEEANRYRLIVRKTETGPQVQKEAL